MRNSTFAVKKYTPFTSQNFPNRFNNNFANNFGHNSGNTFRNFNTSYNQPKPLAATPPVSNNTHVPMEIDRTRRPQAANMQRRPLICYNCGRPGHRKFECPENHIRAIDMAEEESEHKDNADKGFMGANED